MSRLPRCTRRPGYPEKYRMTKFTFRRVDVFTSRPLLGNPLAVVVGADALTDTQMAAFANWTNLSETTFLLQPRMTGADYRVRIFTPQRELPYSPRDRRWRL
jgi:PhzF family phenazine biosynthesis protein